MLIGGFQKFSLSDYPGRISAILFTRGCNLRCPYCHNPELVDPGRFTDLFDQEEILLFIESRSSRLQGVVISGGEPTIQPDLPDFTKRIKKSGFLVKLDTNGSDPGMIERLITEKTVDYIAMDLKAPPDSYKRISRVKIDPRKILSSMALIRASGIEHEFRTTYAPSLLSRDEMAEIGRLTVGSRFIVQKMRRSKALDPVFMENTVPSDLDFDELQAFLTRRGIVFETR